MKATTYLKFLAVIAVQFVSADESETDLYSALHKALNTANNLYELQKIFYPSNGKPITTISVFIPYTDMSILDIEFGSDPHQPAFWFDQQGERYRRMYYDSCDVNITHTCADRIDVYPYTMSLNSYLEKFMPILKFADLSYFWLLSEFTNYGHTIEVQSRNVYLNMTIEKLSSIPSTYEFITALTSLMSWTNYFARAGNLTTSTPRLESDRLVAVHTGYYNYSGQKGESNLLVSSDVLHIIAIIAFVICLNIFICFFGLYSLHLNLTKLVLKNQTFFSDVKESILFWSTSVGLFVVNVTCFILEIYFINISSKDMYFVLLFFPTYVLVFIEVFVVFIRFHDQIEVSSRVCGSEKQWFVRLAHSIAVGNMLWFVHRAGNCSIVSIYFIAIFPAPTLLAITLCLVTVITFILSIYNVSCILNSMSAKHMCFALFLALIGFGFFLVMFLFTVIFMILILHGLSASNIGGIILSLILPIVLLPVNYVVNKHLKKISEENAQEKGEQEPFLSKKKP